MAELQPQDIEELLQELEGENGVKESLTPEVEELLRVLQSDDPYLDRYSAALELGNLRTSGPRILHALTVAQKSDPHPDVRKAAAGSLGAPAHREYLQLHPEVIETIEKALRQAPSEEKVRRTTHEAQSRNLLQRLKWSAGAGLAAGILVGFVQAQQALSPGGASVCGTGVLVALALGAVVGAVVGFAVGGSRQEQKERITGLVIGAVVAALVAALAYFPALIWQVVEMGGP